jgi:selenide,water dikinase
MNGRPLTAMNIVAFPDNDAPLGLLSEILRGAADRVTLAGAVTVGGHSLRDSEIKFGLSVTGLVDPAELLTNAGARPGDGLVLTKPLGTGFVTTANKKGDCPPEALASAVASMTQLNAVGRDALREAGGAHALTDITGYGLAGHGSEMAEGSGLTVEIDVSALPVLDGVLPLAVPRYFTRASKSNREFLDGRLRVGSGVDPVLAEFVFDAQTSGGLLIAVEPGHVDRLVAALRSRGALAAAVVGRVTERQGDVAVVLY